MLLFRKKLHSIITQQLDLNKSNNLNIKPSEAGDLLASLGVSELSVAVVGEIKRGKSTFLNALVGAKLFPSRVTICTAGVTILDNGPEPAAEVWYKDKKPEKVPLPKTDPMASLEMLVSRKNPNVKDIQKVIIWYPNQFSGNGVLLVDTPGVNDPDYWREEITYAYLANADAVIMLLDPMQPLSASEVEFLDKKILGQNIANLIFVVNKIDQVNPQERESALKRIYKLLSRHVPNPAVFAVASKPALEAKLAGNEAMLKTSGFPEFEAALMDFLAKGRGGLLLRTKIQKGQGHLASMEESLSRRLGALDQAKNVVEQKLKNAKKKKDGLDGQRKEMENEINSRRKGIEERLQNTMAERQQFLQNSLKPAIQQQPDIQALRADLLTFQRDTIGLLHDGIQEEYSTLISDYGAVSTALEGEVRKLLGEFDRAATGALQALEVEHELVEVSRTDKKAGGALVGAGLGAAAGMAVASTLTTTTLTAAGTLVTGAALSTLGILGVGILTGGIGLFFGIGAAMLLGGNREEEKKRKQVTYIDTQDMVNNTKAAEAADRFMNNLEAAIPSLARALVQAVIIQTVKPVKEEIESQGVVIKMIESNLNSTVEQQESVRNELGGQFEEVNQLKGKYAELVNSLEAGG